MISHPRECFYQFVKRDFVPLLRVEGFKGSGSTFWRIRGEAIHVVNLQGTRHGGKCCVNLGLHLSFLPTWAGIRAPVGYRWRVEDCEFRERLHDEGEHDHWWAYGATEDESEASVSHLIDTFERYGKSFLDPLEPFPECFEKVTPHDLDAGNLTTLPSPMTMVCAALTMARIMNHLGRSEKCRAFAEVGLRHLHGAIRLKTELEQLRDVRN